MEKQASVFYDLSDDCSLPIKKRKIRIPTKQQEINRTAFYLDERNAHPGHDCTSSESKSLFNNGQPSHVFPSYFNFSQSMKNAPMENWRGNLSQIMLESNANVTKNKQEHSKRVPREDCSAYDKLWIKHFNDLIDFQKEHGHCNVPQRYPPNKTLGKWVHKQRQAYKKIDDSEASSLSMIRLSILKNIGFRFATSNRAEALWQQRYKELLAFKRQFGHCSVPQKYSPNKALGKWVHRQRNEFKKMRMGEPSFLTADRIEALERIDFQTQTKKPAILNKLFLNDPGFAMNKFTNGSCYYNIPPKFIVSHMSEQRFKCLRESRKTDYAKIA